MLFPHYTKFYDCVEAKRPTRFFQALSPRLLAKSPLSESLKGLGLSMAVHFTRLHVELALRVDISNGVHHEIYKHSDPNSQLQLPGSRRDLILERA
jgi:hypothetical protein